MILKQAMMQLVTEEFVNKIKEDSRDLTNIRKIEG